MGGWSPKSTNGMPLHNTPRNSHDSVHAMPTSWFARWRGSAPVVPLANDDPEIDLEHGVGSPNLNYIPDESKAALEDKASPGDANAINAHEATAEDVPWDIPLSPFPGVIGGVPPVASDHDLASLAGGGGVNVDDSVVGLSNRPHPVPAITRKSSISQLLTESFKQVLQLTSKETTFSKNARQLAPLQVNPFLSPSFSFLNSGVSLSKLTLFTH